MYGFFILLFTLPITLSYDQGQKKILLDFNALLPATFDQTTLFPVIFNL
jgi:hypothetical protein